MRQAHEQGTLSAASGSRKKPNHATALVDCYVLARSQLQMSVGIKGVVPGEATEQYIHRQLLACKFWVRV